MGCDLLNCRQLACIVLSIFLPASLVAQESAGAVLKNNGGVSLNKNPAPATNVLYKNDLIETQKNSLARIELTGSNADINAETMVQFEGDELVLDHGSLSVNTSRGLRVRVGCITILPVNANDWTHYEVADVDGRVTVWARKSDAYIDVHTKNLQQAMQPQSSKQSNRSIVREGEQKARDEKCVAADMKQSAAAAGPGAWLNNPWAVGGGAVAIAGATCWALCQHEDPLSPTKP